MSTPPLVFLPALLLLGLVGCAPAEGDPPTYWTDVKPVLETHCTRCHFAGGQGGFDFHDLETVDSLGESIVRAVDDRRMPLPAADPACRDYQGSHRLVMPPEAADVLRAWVDGGKVEGDPAAAQSGDEAEITLANPDMELTLRTRYQPTFDDARNPGNEYRCFPIEHGREEAFFVNGLAPIIDNRELVHHILIYRVERPNLPPDVDWERGWDCIDDAGANAEGMVAGWAPGAMPIEFPDGMGIRVNADEVIVLQMHYYSSDEDVAAAGDQSGYALRTVDEVETPVQMVPLGLFNFDIPAGEESYSDSQQISLPFGATIWGTFPHMHVLGSGYRFWSDGEAGNNCLAESDRYDFGNQVTYMFEEPAFVPEGDTLHIECTWNNSTSNPERIHDQPIDTGYGERTDEEMCFQFTLLSVGDQAR